MKMADQKKPAPKPEPIPQDIQNALMDRAFEKKQKAMEKEIYGSDATPVKKAKGGTASSRADGCAVRGKTRGKIY
jgi:hypothetical protein